MSGEYRYKAGRYVGDSTKGSSRIDPKTYKRDVLMQVWMQSRHLATLLKYLDNSGAFVRFRSEIVQVVIEQVLHHLVDNGEVEMVELAEDARAMLENRFGATSNPSGRGGKNVYHNLTLDSMRKESGGVQKREIVKTAESQTQDSQASQGAGVDWEKIQKRIKEEEEKEARGKLEESMERIRGTGQIDESNMSEEGGVITPIGRGSSVVYQKDMDAYEEREENREESEQDEKSMKVLEKLEEMALERIHMKEIEEDEEPGREDGEDKEGKSGGGDSGSDGAESDGTDTSGDSLQTG